jgi:hypothetical protein
MREHGTKKLFGQRVSNEEFERYKNASPAEKRQIENNITINVESYGDARRDAKMIGAEVTNALRATGNQAY